MNKRNIITAAVSLSLVACLSVGATLAYFTDNTESKQNTFTTGKVGIGIVDELPVDATFNTDWTAQDTDSGIQYSNIQPGDTLGKIVGVTVDQDSSNAYVAMRVTVNGANLPEGYAAQLASQIESQAEKNDWLVNSYVDSVTGYQVVDCYYVGTAIAGQEVGLFDNIQIPATWGNEVNADADAGFTVDVKAAAVQAANLEAPNPETPNESYTQLLDLLNTEAE